MITKHELIKLAKGQDPESELYKMSYGDILGIKDEIEKLMKKENDDKLFSILMKLKSHIMIVEEQIRDQEIKKIYKLTTLEEIVSYIEKIGMVKKVLIYA